MQAPSPSAARSNNPYLSQSQSQSQSLSNSPERTNKMNLHVDVSPSGGAHHGNNGGAGYSGVGGSRAGGGGGYAYGQQTQQYSHQNQNQNRYQPQQQYQYQDRYDDTNDDPDHSSDQNHNSHAHRLDPALNLNPHGNGNGDDGMDEGEEEIEFDPAIIQGNNTSLGGGIGATVGGGGGGEDEVDDDASSEGIPDEHIDFTLNYALHTFVATVEGQASVMKGDSLILLDDSNSYWWLIKVLKTEEVGYIPAENIETPFERLARLNKHRNIDLAAPTKDEHAEAIAKLNAPNNLMNAFTSSPPHATTSLLSRIKSISPQPPSNNHNQNPNLDENGKRKVIFAPPTYVDHPGVTWSESSGSGDEDDSSGDEYEERESELVEGQIVREGEGDEGLMEDDSEDDFGTEEGNVGASKVDGRGVGDVNMDARGDQQQQQLSSSQGSGSVRGDDLVKGRSTPERYQDALTSSQNSSVGSVRPEDMEPDDGMEWDDRALQEAREAKERKTQDAGRARSGSSVNGQRPVIAEGVTTTTPVEAAMDAMRDQPGTNGMMDPAAIGQDQAPRRITVTPAVAQYDSPRGGPAGNGPALGPPARIENRQPSGGSVGGPASGSGQGSDHGHGGQNQSPGMRNVSNASSAGGYSVQSQGSIRSMQTSPDSTGSRERDEDEFGRKVGKKDKGGKVNEDGSLKKKRSGVFSGLFSKKKDKEKKSSKDPREAMSSSASFESERSVSVESHGRLQDSPELHMNGRSSGQNGHGGNLQGGHLRQYENAKPQPHVSTGSLSSGGQNGSQGGNAVSPHAARLQQMDQQQQQLYQQYMARSPGASPVDASRSFGTQAAATVAQSSAAHRLAQAQNSQFNQSPMGRPGSIILSGPHTAGGPLLNVVRIFAGDQVDSQYTFKTVLLNETTNAKDLVKQAVQRFRLEGVQETDLADYFLTIKDVGGEEEFALESEQKPLEAFNELCERIGEEQSLPNTVKRSSVGSISSISSNLSLKPAIMKLGMNDFSDDSTVKLFLNRRRGGVASTFGSYGSDMTSTGRAFSGSQDFGPSSAAAAAYPAAAKHRPESLDIDLTSQPELSHSPSARFCIQVSVSSEDLPDDLVFDSQSDAVIPRAVLKERSHQVGQPATGERRRLLLIAKGSTVAETIEAALDRFGIMDGVVDGGDEVEDKVGKRRSNVRVRYALGASQGRGEERLLQASHKVFEAYDTPPKFKVLDKTITNRRRSREWSRELTVEQDDILPTDPVFYLRRVGPRTVALASSDSAPLDDVALKQRRSSDTYHGMNGAENMHDKPKTPQEIIAEQRAASRAKQNAMLSAHANANQGLDVILPDKGRLRSSRISMGGRDEVRYSYISEEGDAWDVSQVVQEELAELEMPEENRIETLRSPRLVRQATDQTVYHTAPSTPNEMPEMVTDSSGLSTSSTSASDLLQSFIKQAQEEDKQEFIAEKLERVMSKVKAEQSTPRPASQASAIHAMGMSTNSVNGLGTIPENGTDYSRSRSPGFGDSPYFISRDATVSPQLDPIPASIRQAVDEAPSRSGSRMTMHSPLLESNFRSVTPVGQMSRPIAATRIGPSRHRQQPSIASMLSDVSANGRTPMTSTPLTSGTTAATTPPSQNPDGPRKVLPKPKQPVKYKDDFRFGAMMAGIRARADRAKKAQVVQKPTLNDIDRRLFGPDLAPGLAKLQPRSKEYYSRMAGRLAEMEAENAKILQAATALVVQQRKKKASEVQAGLDPDLSAEQETAQS